jgi:hypothetical protein
LPLYFRKRPGSKSIKANLTQRGLSSFTFTTGSKKGLPRLNYNTSRGFSFSFPGTGIAWRQKVMVLQNEKVQWKKEVTT